MTLVCKRCAKLPRAEREAIEQADELEGYLRQRHISDKNIARLEVLRRSENPAIAVTALLVLEIAKVAPYRKSRLRRLRQERCDLYEIWIDLREELFY